MSIKTTYKIRNKETGLISTGGPNPRWVEKGKSWTSLANIRDHSDQIARDIWVDWPYDNAEVVAFETTFNIVISAVVDLQVLRDETKRGVQI